MKDNMENFREITNTVLKDIYASDELKRKTLEKCTAKKTFKINPAILSTASAAVLLIAFGLCNYFIHNPIVATNSNVNNQIKNEAKNTSNTGSSMQPVIVSENKPDVKSKSSVSTSKTLDSDTGSGNKNNEVQNINKAAVSSTSTSKDEIDNSQNVSSGSDKEYTVNYTLKPLTLADADKYFGSNILFPQYVPEGFSLTSISIPDNKLKCVKLRYSIRTAYFEILQSKSLSELKGTQIVSIGNNPTYVTYTKDENSNKITVITWIMNNVQYSISGDLPESLLINIAKYLN